MQRIRPRPETTEPETTAPVSDAHGVDLADAILDEIDAVLEESALQRSYVQKGGQ